MMSLEPIKRRLFPGVYRAAEAERAASAKAIAALTEAVARQSATIDEWQRDTALPEAQRSAMTRSEWSLQRDLGEAIWMGGSGPAQTAPTTESIRVKERLWDLELALEDRGWTRQLAVAQTEFSRFGLQQLILICRLYRIKNPLIKRGVEISGIYVFGRGVEVRSEDDASDQVIKQFLRVNEKELSQTGLVEKEQTVLTDGNLFFVFFTDELSGECKIRTIDACEIAEIITDPDDCSVPWYYHRRWLQHTWDGETGVQQMSQQEAYYPAVDYDPPVKPAVFRQSVPVMWDNPVIHEKIGGLAKWLFGAPYIYAAIDWARATKTFLENWATINTALARFAWTYETKGGQQAIQSFQQALQTTLMNGGQQIENNPPPVTGAAFAAGPGSKLTPVKSAGMQTDSEQCRRMVLMVAAAFGLPETFFGDASVGSLATAMSLDRPTELKFLDRQEAWRCCLRRICMYVLMRSNTSAAGKLKEARAKVGKNGDLSDINVEVVFPSVLEHDLAQTVTAIVQAATLGGFEPSTMDIRTVSKQLWSEIGVKDIDAILDKVWPPGKYKPGVNFGIPEPPPPPPGSPPAAMGPDGKPMPQPGAHLVAPSFNAESVRDEARLLEAIHQLKRATEALGLHRDRD